MKPELDEPGIEDGAGGVLVIAHFRRRPLRDRNGNAQGDMAGERLDRRSRSFAHNPANVPAMAVAIGREPQPWAPDQDGPSMGTDLTPPRTDRGHRSDPDLNRRTAPSPRDPHSAAWDIEKAPYERRSGHEDDEPAG